LSPTKDLNKTGSHNLKIGIVINSRLKSSRIPNKAIKSINGVRVIEHLINRIKDLGFNIIIAVPLQELMTYNYLSRIENVSVYGSIYDDDPLARMNEVAEHYGLDYVVRITHDKIFIDTEILNDCLNYYVINSNIKKDYIFLTNAIPGTGFEIISKDALKKASDRFKNIEYIGYAIREVTSNIISIDAKNNISQSLRLLIDYPNDINLMEVIFSQLGNNCTLRNIKEFILNNPDIMNINKLPKITIYTCALNAEKWIERAIESVIIQKGIDIEYILIDDFSNDKTPMIMAEYASKYPFIKFIRNEKNIGLSSSCNVALSEAKGEFIFRLDADDYLISSESISKIYEYSIINKYEITYPDYYKVFRGVISFKISGELEHHAGCALFNRSALNYIKFTDGLRGHDSLDVFIRAKEILKIGYFREPLFCYVQREDSLSHTNLEERNRIKNNLIENSKVNS